MHFLTVIGTVIIGCAVLIELLLKHLKDRSERIAIEKNWRKREREMWDSLKREEAERKANPPND
jgi:hypothetical protein